MAFLTEPLAYGFFVRALVVGTVIGAMCGAMGVFIVLRRMSYIGHGLAHSVLGGVAVALTLGYDLYLGAAVATLLSALLIDRIARREGLYADAAIGIVTTAMFALGVLVISVWRAVRISLESLLFGNVLGVRDADLWLALAVTVAFAVTVFALYKPLVFTTFDPTVAAAHGVRTGVTELVFNLLVAAVVIASVRVLGVLLIAAAVVIPAATARLLISSFGRLLVVSTALGAAVSVAGLYLSFYVDVPSGATIVLVGAGLFTIVALGTAVTGRSRLARARQAHAGLLSAAVGEAPAAAQGAGRPPWPPTGR
jgi:ABC-type Mn2+/Zn2+ transport system permease subunit